MNETFELRNGFRIPKIGFGTWRAKGEEAQKAVLTALECGYRHIDTAAYYGNEPDVAAAIEESVNKGLLKREELFVTTKLWNTERGYDKAIQAFRQSLKALHLDYLDLYLIHWPASSNQFSNWQQINLDTWRAFETLYRDGLIKSIGVSNFHVHHLEPLMDHAEVLPMVNQLEIHPGFDQHDNVEWCKKHGVQLEAWRPLGNGELLQHPIITEIATQHQATPAHVCMQWLLQQDILPLPKSVTPKRIAANINMPSFVLSEDDMRVISGIQNVGGELHPDKIDF